MITTTKSRTMNDAVSESPVAAEKPRIQLRELFKHYTRENGEVTTAVNGIDLDIAAGEFLILLGPSGCGKTTLLRSISGLETPDSGRVNINDIVLYDSTKKVSVPVERRPVSMVFQSYGLWPHMTVFENIAYPLRSRKVPKNEIPGRVEEVVKAAGIEGLETQYPTQLSGGQQQRVALARAVVSANDVVLFDEPLSNVDAKVRDQLRIEIQRLQKRLGFTAVYVTHDQDEAMLLGHRIAVLEKGNIAQLGTPREVYETPESAYVARFIGAVDEIKGTVVGKSAAGELEVKTTSNTRWTVRTDKDVKGDVYMMTRPERWTIHHEKVEGTNIIEGEVRAALYLSGSRTECLIRTADDLIRVWAPHGQGAAEGAKVWISVEPEDILIFERTP